MTIVRVRTEKLSLPLDPPFRTAIHDIRTLGCLLVFLEGEEGAVGESYLWLPGTARLPVMAAMVESLAPHLDGRDPLAVRAIWQAMWDDIAFVGHAGVAVFAVSALEVACWDLAAKARGLAVADLFGRVRDAVPVYADGGLSVAMTVPELVAQARDFAARGFRAVKMRIGRARIAEELARVAAVREAIGPDVALMVDANQGLDAAHAIRLGRGLEAHDVAWFEEPVPATDFAAARRVRAAIATPIAAGQSLYGPEAFAALIAHGAADVLMPDLIRVGGVGALLTVAQMAQGYGLAVSPHMFAEHTVSLCAALPNATYAEQMPWFAPLFRAPPAIRDGAMQVPEGPGFGVPFDADAIARLRIRD